MAKHFKDEEIQTCLEKVLESRVFEKSDRAQNLLEYLIAEELQGKADALKGFSIAVDVFDRDESFDAATDPLVRVHAGRLRDLLAKYYADEGVEDRIEISIPLGGYRPYYTEKNKTEQNKIHEIGSDQIKILKLDEEMKEAPSQPNPSQERQINYLWLAFVGLATVIGFLVYLFFASGYNDRADSERPITDQHQIASTNFLPVVRVITDKSDDDLLQFSERLVNALSRFDTIIALKVIDLNDAAKKSSSWEALDYGMFVSKIRTDIDNTPILKIELVGLQKANVLRAEEHPFDIWDQPESQVLIARKITGIATPEGVIYADLSEKGQLNPSLDCLIKVRNYYSLSNAKKHRDAYECTGGLVSKDDASGLLRAIHGGLVAGAVGKKYVYSDLSIEPDEAMSSALIIALKGVDLAPLSARSAREVGFIYSWRGAFEQMTHWFERANELNPNDTSIGASYGYGLVLTGKYGEAAEVLGRAIQSSTRHPNWWHLYHGLALLMENRFDEASQTIAPIGMAKRGLYYTMLNTVFAYQKKERNRAAYLVRELKERYPKFAANPKGSFEKRHFPPSLIDALIAGLENAGL